MRAAGSCHSPGEGPTVAVEHRQAPEIDRLRRKTEGDEVAERIQIGAAVMVDHTLRITGGAGGVEQAYRLPFIFRLARRKRRVALLEKGFVVQLAQQISRFREGIVDIDDEDLFVQDLKRLRDHR